MEAMAPRYILSEYVEQALSGAAYEKLEDGSYAGRLPAAVWSRSPSRFASVSRNCVRLSSIGFWWA